MKTKKTNNGTIVMTGFRSAHSIWIFCINKLTELGYDVYDEYKSTTGSYYFTAEKQINNGEWMLIEFRSSNHTKCDEFENKAINVIKENDFYKLSVIDNESKKQVIDFIKSL